MVYRFIKNEFNKSLEIESWLVVNEIGKLRYNRISVDINEFSLFGNNLVKCWCCYFYIFVYTFWEFVLLK